MDGGCKGVGKPVQSASQDTTWGYEASWPRRGPRRLLSLAGVLAHGLLVRAGPARRRLQFQYITPPAAAIRSSVHRQPIEGASKISSIGTICSMWPTPPWPV